MAREIVIDGALKEKWPDTRLGCFLYTTNVEKKNEELWTYLKQTTFKIVRDRLFDMSVNEFPNIRESRSAYKAFGKDPSRYRVSSEALIRRVGQGKGLYQVNTVVDANNLISIESGFSVGSYDTEKLEGNLILRIGMPNETYKGIGKEELNIEGLPLICDERGLLQFRPRMRKRLILFHDLGIGGVLLHAFNALFARVFRLVHLRCGDDLAVVGLQHEVASGIRGLDHELSHVTAPFSTVERTCRSYTAHRVRFG